MKNYKRQRTYQTRNKPTVPEAKESTPQPETQPPAPSMSESIDDIPDENKLVIDLGEEQTVDEPIKSTQQAEIDDKPESHATESTSQENKNDQKVTAQVDPDRSLIKQIYEKTKKAVTIEVVFCLEDLIKSNKLELDDLEDNKLLYCLRSVDDKNFNQFENLIKKDENYQNGRLDVDKLMEDWKKLNHTSSYRSNSPISPRMSSSPSWKHKRQSLPIKPGPDESKLKTLLERNDYVLEVRNKIRSVTWRRWLDLKCKAHTFCDENNNQVDNTSNNGELFSMHHRFGKESFIGRIPEDIFEDELLELFEPYGPIIELNLFINEKTGFNKGYAFVTFSSRENNEKAIKNLNNYEVRPNQRIIMELSNFKTKLFVANLPFGNTLDELERKFRDLFDGIMSVTIGSKQTGDTKSISYCFVKFIDHMSAVRALKCLQSTPLACFNDRALHVNWATGHSRPFRQLGLKGLPSGTRLEELSECMCKYGKVEWIKLFENHAYVNFVNPFDAAVAQEELDMSTFKGQIIHVNMIFHENEMKKAIDLVPRSPTPEKAAPAPSISPFVVPQPQQFRFSQSINKPNLVDSIFVQNIENQLQKNKADFLKNVQLAISNYTGITSLTSESQRPNLKRKISDEDSSNSAKRAGYFVSRGGLSEIINWNNQSSSNRKYKSNKK